MYACALDDARVAALRYGSVELRCTEQKLHMRVVCTCVGVRVGRWLRECGESRGSAVHQLIDMSTNTVVQQLCVESVYAERCVTCDTRVCVSDAPTSSLR